MLVVLVGPLVQADDGSANVTLKVNIVSPPSVITIMAIGIVTGQGNLYGYLTSLGTASSVEVNFGWDTQSHADDATAYAHWTEPQTKTRRGIFKAQVTGLTPGTTYYVRAKAEGDVTSYGQELSFTTFPIWPWWDLFL